METIWFWIIACMLSVYVVLDGFDFGAGIIHLLVAKTDEERRTVLGAIGPLWDGNEVWLLASGGVLVYAFPRAYSSGFSGFYLPLMMVLWLLILRGLSIEFRSLEKNPLWRSFWDGVFTFSSVLMAIVLGAALGNIIRGVPLEETGFFNGPLFTDFRPGTNPGILDWYTVLVGVFALCVLAGHGALYLVWKTLGPVQERSRMLAGRLWRVTVVLGVAATTATAIVQPSLHTNLLARVWAWPLVLLSPACLILIFVNLKQRRELATFLSSVGFIVGMLAATAAGIFPNVLVSSINDRYNLNIYNAAAGELGLRAGLIWWTIALLLAVGYFTFLFHSFRGKVVLGPDGH